MKARRKESEIQYIEYIPAETSSQKFIRLATALLSIIGLGAVSLIIIFGILALFTPHRRYDRTLISDEEELQWSKGMKQLKPMIEKHKDLLWQLKNFYGSSHKAFPYELILAEGYGEMIEQITTPLTEKQINQWAEIYAKFLEFTSAAAVHTATDYYLLYQNRSSLDLFTEQKELIYKRFPPLLIALIWHLDIVKADLATSTLANSYLDELVYDYPFLVSTAGKNEDGFRSFLKNRTLLAYLQGAAEKVAKEEVPFEEQHSFLMGMTERRIRYEFSKSPFLNSSIKSFLIMRMPYFKRARTFDPKEWFDLEARLDWSFKTYDDRIFDLE